MNSIVEKLRSYGEGCTCAAHSSNECCCDAVWGDNYTSEAADLIESQDQRIKELEAYNATRTDEMIAATRRIRELEASLASMVQGVKISIPTQTMEQEFQSHYRRGYEAGKAALRQRIDDAQVVAWTDDEGNFCISAPECCGCSIPLISKEDLQK